MNENQMGVLLEDIRERVKAIAEGQGIMDGKIDKLEGRVSRIEADVSVLKSDVAVLKSDMIKVTATNETIKKFMGNVEDGLNDHKKRIIKLEQKAANE